MKNSIGLNQENMDAISSRVEKPTYDRDSITASIVHIGVGNFHRSHQAFYAHELMQNHGILDCGICGVGLMDFDQKIYNVLKDQDGLYTLMIKELDGTFTAKVIGSIVDFLFGPENPSAVIEKIAHPDIKIISLTITEGGYNLNEGTGKFDFSNPLIQQDLENPDAPKTVFGYITQALKLRKNRGERGLTIQSCDNIQENGKVAKKALTEFIKEAEPELVDWVQENVSFPNAMVDRITPVTVAEDIETLKEEFQIEDKWPVVCEPFNQWVVEDHFVSGRPAWEKVGVQFVEDVLPFENMKLRLLNAGHSCLGILGALHGYNTIDQAATDKDFSKFLRDFMDIEVTPTLGSLNGMDLDAYKKTLLDRFQNVYIKDLISRICLESSAKIPIFLLSTLRDQLKGNQNIDRITLVIAAWCKYNDGVDENNNPYEIKDVMKDTLIKAAALSHKNPIAFLEIEAVFGDLVHNEVFVNAFKNALDKVRNKSIKDCIQEINFSAALV